MTKEKAEHMIRVFAHWESKKCCAYFNFIFPSRLHIMIQSVAGPRGRALIYNNLYNWITKNSCETLLYNWREQQQNWASLCIAGSSGWFYQALSQLSAFLHFNYQSKFLLCLFLHFYPPNLLLYIFYVSIHRYLYMCNDYSYSSYYIFRTKQPNCRLFSHENSTFFYHM